MFAHQLTLLGTGDPVVSDMARFERVELDAHSWIDLADGFVRGADTLLDVLVREVEWSQGRRRMYERMVDDPRLSHWYRAGAELPHAVLYDVKATLERRYGVTFGSLGCNYYRAGDDSVAWHADKELREVDDSLIAILTVGGPRPFLVRSKAGGPSRKLLPGSGDLLVMGGACQRDWEHHIPKVKYAPPRISCTWRWSAAAYRARGHESSGIAEIS